ncbi:MAG: DUF2974 domain-containing protein [Hespellia sp.]|nr:DUF2974 domain-containing protein [Hespellia sp.]
MGNILDYLDWRGDLTLRNAEFNEVDNLILALVSYVVLEGIVPGVDSKESVSVEEAAKAYFLRHTAEEIEAGTSFIHMIPFLLKKMGESRRFKNARLSNYVNRIDVDQQKQFSALHITLDDRTTYISFCGTDDTIVGWQEDFNMSFKIVPSQTEAVEYVEQTMKGFFRKYCLGGHSKGGNLAIYAATKCSAKVKKRILTVYNNDGPGFSKEMVSDPAYREAMAKMNSYVPESSIIGMLLEHGGKYKIVGSSQKGVMQHDGLSWEVRGKHFVECEERTTESVMFEETLKGWLYDLDEKQKENFISDLFDAIRATGAENLSEIGGSGLRGMTALFKSLSKMDSENKAVINKLFSAFTNEYNKKVVMPILGRIVPQVGTKTKKDE